MWKSQVPSSGLFQRTIMTMMTALSAMSPEIPAMINNCNMTTSLDFLIDSGAGRNLISKKGLPSEFAEHFTDPPEKLRFATWGGLRQGSDAIKREIEWKQHILLLEGASALSLGIQVNERQKPWVWFPGQLPFFIKADRIQDVTFHCPESANIYVDRVVQNVPILHENLCCDVGTNLCIKGIALCHP